ncbi:MAG: hypothetical protein KGH49_03075 [Candidatus Micrarchaeota archaeon]|nr:hypothetical protein [Candidatus Micrarchaeota archaeon]
MSVAANPNNEALLKKEAALKNVAEKVCSILTESKDPQKFMRNDFRVMAKILLDKPGSELNQDDLASLKGMVMDGFLAQKRQ